MNGLYGNTFGFGTLPVRCSMKGDQVTVEVVNMLGESAHRKGALFPGGINFYRDHFRGEQYMSALSSHGEPCQNNLTGKTLMCHEHSPNSPIILPLLMSFCGRLALLSCKVACAGALLFVAGCSDNRVPVTVPISLQEVAGRYELSLSDFGTALDKRIALISPRPSIEFRADGTVSLSNLPVIADDLLQNFVCSDFRTGTGTFQIEKPGYEKHSGVVTHFYGVKLSCGTLPGPVDRPSLCRQGTVLALSWRDYFDGDFSERMVFVRVAPAEK